MGPLHPKVYTTANMHAKILDRLSLQEREKTKIFLYLIFWLKNPK